MRKDSAPLHRTNWFIFIGTGGHWRSLGGHQDPLKGAVDPRWCRGYFCKTMLFGTGPYRDGLNEYLRFRPRDLLAWVWGPRSPAVFMRNPGCERYSLISCHEPPSYPWLRPKYKTRSDTMCTLTAWPGWALGWHMFVWENLALTHRSTFVRPGRISWPCLVIFTLCVTPVKFLGTHLSAVGCFCFGCLCKKNGRESISVLRPTGACLAAWGEQK